MVFRLTGDDTQIYLTKDSVHVWGADADGLAEHVTVLQRPLVAHDALKLVRSMALENHGECGCTGSLLDKVT